MAWLNRLPGYERAPAGLEWAILRRLPTITVFGTALPLAVAIAAALFLDGGVAAEAKRATTIWIAVASALVLHWTVVFTLALGCLIVWVAKGPAYVADAYELIDSDRPAR